MKFKIEAVAHLVLLSASHDQGNLFMESIQIVSKKNFLCWVVFFSLIEILLSELLIV